MQWLISQCCPGLTWTEDGHRVLPRTQQNWSLMQGSTSTREVHMFSTILCLKDRAERLQQFHCKKVSPPSKTITTITQGLSPEAMSSFRDIQCAYGNRRALTQSPHRSRWNLTLNHCERKRNEGSKEREGENERTYISGEKERGGQSLPIRLTLHLGCQFDTLQEFSGNKRGTRYQGSLKIKLFLNK